MSATQEFQEDLDRYLDDLESASNERQRAQYFIEFFRRDLDVAEEFVGHPSELRPELEEPLRGVEQHEQPNRSLSEFIEGPEGETRVDGEEAETVFVNGRLDARVGNLIIEFKDRLSFDLDDAKDQLRKYVYLLHQEGIDEDFVCFATDGKVFKPYEARISEPLESRDDVSLSQLPMGDLDLEGLDADHVHRWFQAIITERVRPLVENLDDWFGIGSDIYIDSIALLEEAYEESETASVYHGEWEKYLRYAHGEVPEEEGTLFLRHTYLGSFAKLLTYMVFVRGSMPRPEDAAEILRGEVDEPFPENLFEKDLFSWIGETDQGDELAEQFLDALLNFNLGRVDQDVFKHLYQRMVSPDVRHDLGEYYTPDWLAEYILEELDLDPGARILDPGCGSGTFLVEAIQDKRFKSPDPPSELVSSITTQVVGIDVHPLAVAVAKANYIASIMDLLQYRRGTLQIPVYLSDSVIFQEELEDEEEIEMAQLEGEKPVRGPIPAGEDDYYLPQKALNYPSKLDIALDLIQENLEDGDGFEWQLIQKIPEFEDISHIFESIRGQMATAAAEGRDSIHAYILKNFYRPLYLSENGSFDAIIGNPPWLSYRYMGERQQQRVGELLQMYDLYPGPENVTQIELATLFAVRCMDLYLQDGGELGFVMPRSIFSANQHDPFRRGAATVPYRLNLVLDLDEVGPLFNVPASAILAQKGYEFEYPVPRETFSADLEDKNLSLEEAIDTLEIEDGEIFLQGNGVTSWDELPELERSEYYSSFLNGATLYPRSLVLVDLDEATEEFGFDPVTPPVRTADHAQKTAGETYGEVIIQSEVERKFLYATLLSTDLVPFTHRDFRSSVIPAIPERIESSSDQDGGVVQSSHHHVIDENQADDGGYNGLNNWLHQANEHWDGQGDRDTISNQLDYRNKISRQDPTSPYKVLYPASGTNLVACVVHTDEVGEESKLDLQGLIVDHKAYYYETSNEDEAYYLSSILNSNVLNEMIKNLQSRGEFGARDIHKAPFEFPIPIYDRNDPEHQRLSEMGKQAEEKAEERLVIAEEQYTHIGYIRKKVREGFEKELEEIDGIVERLIQSEAEINE